MTAATLLLATLLGYRFDGKRGRSIRRGETCFVWS